jgi:hypothetical protein
MISVSSILGLGSSALLLVALGLMCLRASTRPARARVLMMLGLVVLAAVPINGLPVAGYARGLVGDLSITTMIILVAACFQQLTGRHLFNQRNIFLTLSVIVLATLALYPMTLGLSSVDPYALGYGSRGFELVLLVLVVVAWFFDAHLIVLCVTLAIGAYLLRLLESPNLWDYLIDAPIACFSIVWVVGEILKRLTSRSPTREQAA